jgi:hypothetical protein
MLRFSMVSLIEGDIPMVQMMLVRRNSRGAWWSRELAIVYVCVLW